jgi:hypothetical protein
VGRWTARLPERRHVRSNLPSNSSPHPNGHAPSPPAPIALKLGRNIEQRSYDALTANWSASSRGSPFNNTITTLVVSQALTAHAGIPDTHKQYARVGLVLASRPCHIGQHRTSCITLQGPRAGARGTECADQLPVAEVLKMG